MATYPWDCLAIRGDSPFLVPAEGRAVFDPCSMRGLDSFVDSPNICSLYYIEFSMLPTGGVFTPVFPWFNISRFQGEFLVAAFQPWSSTMPLDQTTRRLSFKIATLDSGDLSLTGFQGHEELSRLFP